MKPKQIPGVPIQKKGGFHDTESTKQCKILEINSKFAVLKERFSPSIAGKNTVVKLLLILNILMLPETLQTEFPEKEIL
jgi:hypothetical protein